MTKQDIVRLIVTVIVAAATAVGSFFGVSSLTSCESIDSISVGASVSFPHQLPTDFEQNITNPPTE